MGGRGAASNNGTIGVNRSVTGANPPAGNTIGVDAGVTNAAELNNTSDRAASERRAQRREEERASAARAAAEHNAEASRQLRSARAPSRMSEVQVRNADGVTGRIFRIPPGFRTGNRSGDTMYQVLITDPAGRELWRTNRRGHSAFSQAKDDVAQHLGLERRRRS